MCSVNTQAYTQIKAQSQDSTSTTKVIRKISCSGAPYSWINKAQDKIVFNIFMRSAAAATTTTATAPFFTTQSQNSTSGRCF